MIKNVNVFESALRNPAAGDFATLSDFRLCEDVGIGRTSLFVEAVIEWEGARWMVCAPLRPESSDVARQAMQTACRTGCRAIAEWRMLTGEFRYVDEWGNCRRCDLLLSRLPEGCRLDAAVTGVVTQRLLAALEQLHCEFVRCGVRHRNLKPVNLIFDDEGRLWPLRCWYLTVEDDRAAIDSEFAEVEAYIRSFPEFKAEADAEVGDIEGYDEVCPISDMMRRCREGDLWGYTDDEGRRMLEAQFTYAEDFFENRAVVALGEGRMGVIDRRGRYIVAPEYDMVYVTSDCNFRVMKSGLVGEFDYTGLEVLPLQAGLELENE